MDEAFGELVLAVDVYAVLNILGYDASWKERREADAMYIVYGASALHTAVPNTRTRSVYIPSPTPALIRHT